MTGLSPTACGVAGSTCASCPTGTTCQAGQCLSSFAGGCDPSTCAGCCQGGRCVQPYEQNPSECGTGGQLCQTCGGSSCVGGQCQAGGSAYCGPSTCAGCCDQSGQCLQIAQQANFRCGTAGGRCEACAGGQTCLHGLCQGSGVNASTGTCNASNCSGCCTPQGQCLLLGHQTDWQCGTGGGLCQQCGVGAVCAQGRCSGSSTTPGTTGCSPSNCSGCCTSSGQCVLPQSQNSYQCGIGGYACLSCGGGQCQSGTCQASCGPGNCNGCCSGGTCIPLGSKQSASQCGQSGYACQACYGGQICSAQGSCVQGAKLYGVSARITPKPGDWDDGGLMGPKPDPYIECRLLSTGQSGKTPPQSNTYYPSFGSALILSAPTQAFGGGISCKVVDDDGLLGGQTIGNCNSYGVSAGPIQITSCSGDVERIELHLASS